MPLSKARARKVQYAARLKHLLSEYKNIVLMTVDNVSSHQLQQVRMALRGKAEILMGKNTVIRKVLREYGEETDEKILNLIPSIMGNMGFVFTNGSVAEVRKTILEFKLPAPARSGTFAPDDVIIPTGPTGMEPGQTNFFQALQIPTRIKGGQIEIINEVHLIKKGEKISASEVALLDKLNILPFFYGILVATIYEDGSIYDAAILDITEADILNKFFTGVQMVASIGLELGLPNACSIPHSLANGFHMLVAISLETEYKFEQAEKLLTAGPAAAPADEAAAAAAPVVEEEEEEEESEGDMGFDMFG